MPKTLLRCLPLKQVLTSTEPEVMTQLVRFLGHTASDGG